MANKFIALAYPIPQGCTATYFPEANVLVPITSVAFKSNTPTSKQVILKVKKHTEMIIDDAIAIGLGFQSA